MRFFKMMTLRAIITLFRRHDDVLLRYLRLSPYAIRLLFTLPPPLDAYATTLPSSTIRQFHISLMPPLRRHAASAAVRRYVIAGLRHLLFYAMLSAGEAQRVTLLLALIARHCHAKEKERHAG